MINPKLIEKFYTSAFIQRWNDYPRMMDLTELDKQSHKMIIAFFIAGLEKDVSHARLIEAGVFEFLRRIVITDIRPDVLRKALNKKQKQLDKWVIKELKEVLKNIQKGEFFKRFEFYLNNENKYKKERLVLKAASHLASKWEFGIVYQASKFLNEIEDLKKEIELETEDYIELIGVKRIEMKQKLSKIIDLSGRLRFQKRWSQTPRIPDTSVLGHMFIVALFGYFYSLKINACKKRLVNNFYCALFHDLPEALTRDIISPVKYSVKGLNDIISEYETSLINDKILPLIPSQNVDYFAYILGLYKENGVIKKEEFKNKITINGKTKIKKSLKGFNHDMYDVIDGVALKQCDKLAAYAEATLSISYGVKSKDLLSAKKFIKNSMKKSAKTANLDVNFFKIAKKIEKTFV